MSFDAASRARGPYTPQWFGAQFILPRGTRYLDAAATSLMPRFVLDVQREYFEAACSNPHTEAHALGRASTQLVEDARAAVARLLGAPEAHYATCFVGTGATGALNRAARVLAAHPSLRTRDTVIVTELDHHSNILPWRDSAPRVLHAQMQRDGSLNLDLLRSMISREGYRLRAVAVSAASNVTGYRPPIEDIVSWAHAAGALCVVDAAQAAPHEEISVSGWNADGVALSGHKLYAPGAPGVLILRRSLFGATPAGDVGGGVVDEVTLETARYRERAEDREEAGTPNVPGIVALGAVCSVLQRVGMAGLRDHNIYLGQQLLNGLEEIPRVRVYGSRRPGGRPRLGTVAFNIYGMPYREASQQLDARGLSVRDACFCAHPYVRTLLNHDEVPRGAMNGMVRASFGPWNTPADVAALLVAVRELAAAPRGRRPLPLPARDATCFSLEGAVRQALAESESEPATELGGVYELAPPSVPHPAYEIARAAGYPARSGSSTAALGALAALGAGAAAGTLAWWATRPPRTPRE
jgi:selenocysteine lyase/cysteine desulfurase